MTELIFKEDEHLYLLDGIVLPSVTQVLKPLYDFSTVSPDVLRRAGAFGTAVHKTVELYLQDNLNEDSLDENLHNPLLAFKKWQADYPNFISFTIEKPDYHAKLKYAGTADLTCPDAVIDIKSRKVNMLTDPIQLAGYDHFGSGNRERYVLELKQDATYVFTRLNPTKKSNDEAWSRFRYLLDFHKMQQQINLWRG